MVNGSLWPDFSSKAPPRGMRDMLNAAAGDIDAQTNGDLSFYVDTVGVGGIVDKIRYNCYLRVPKKDYSHLLFRLTTPVQEPWPAVATTPEGEKYPPIQDESQLRNVVKEILTRDRTVEVVFSLLSLVR